MKSGKSNEVGGFIGIFIYSHGDIQQCKLRLSPFEQHGVAFSFVVAEGYILPVDVPVASLQLLYQGAFRDCLATQKPVWTHVVSKRGK